MIITKMDAPHALEDAEERGHGALRDAAKLLQFMSSIIVILVSVLIAMNMLE